MLIMTKSSLATMIGFFISITIGIILIPILKRKKQEQIINEFKGKKVLILGFPSKQIQCFLCF